MSNIDSKDPSLAGEGSIAAGGAAHTVKGHAIREPARRTLPPPEWGREGPRSAASLALERYELDKPISHRSGPRAELASLAAKLNASSRAGNESDERAAAAGLARAAARGGAAATRGAGELVHGAR